MDINLEILLRNYETYLGFLESKLIKFFASQKPFIFCKKGCAKCCQKAQFPYSLLEIKYLLSGFLLLDKEKKKKIEDNLQAVAAKKKKFRGKNFRYDCPFLIDNVCSVYKYRGVICRTFGLMTNNGEGKIKSPFCSELGLNYSNVLNARKNHISVRKYKKLGVKEEPLGFNVGYKYLTSEDFEESFNIKFGDKKPLIDWFLEDNTKYVENPVD